MRSGALGRILHRVGECEMICLLLYRIGFRVYSIIVHEENISSCVLFVFMDDDRIVYIDNRWIFIVHTHKQWIYIH